jgi:peptide/nickel transport system permease protein
VSTITEVASSAPVPASTRTLAWRRLGVAGTAAIAVLGALALAALLAPLLAPHDPDAYDSSAAYAGFSFDHPLGADKLGRDLLSRLMWGARASLLGALVAVGLATAAGVPLGLALAWRGGRVDALVSRVLDVLFAFPAVLLAALAVALYGPGLEPCAIAVGIAYLPWAARNVRGAALRERSKPYVTALEVQGCSGVAICARHLLPNVTGLVTAQATVAFGYALIDIAALSFLGFGVQPPTADWGVMVNSYDAILEGHPRQALFAGGLIVASVMAATVVGSRLSEHGRLRR